MVPKDNSFVLSNVSLLISKSITEITELTTQRLLKEIKVSIVFICLKSKVCEYRNVLLYSIYMQKQKQKNGGSSFCILRFQQFTPSKRGQKMSQWHRDCTVSGCLEPTHITRFLLSAPYSTAFTAGLDGHGTCRRPHRIRSPRPLP